MQHLRKFRRPMGRWGMRNLKPSGFTLVETIVCVGILAIALVAAVSVSQNMYQASVTAERNQAVTDLRYHASRVLNNERLCTGAMGGHSVVSGEPITLGPVATGNTVDRLQINSVELRDPQLVVGNTYAANVEISATKLGQVFGSKDVTISTPVLFLVDNPSASPPRITRCVDTEVDPVANCRTLGGTWIGNACNFCAVMGGTLDTSTGECQTTPVTYFWRASDWSTCDANTNTRTRTVACTDSRTLTSVEDELCTDPKPAVSDTCGSGTSMFCTPNTRSGTSTSWYTTGRRDIEGINDPMITAEDKAAVIDGIDNALRGPFNPSSPGCELAYGDPSDRYGELNYTCNFRIVRGNLTGTTYFNYFQYARGDCPIRRSYESDCIIRTGPTYTVTWYACNENRPW